MSNVERTASKADSIRVDHKETILAVEVAEESNTTVWKLLRENVRVIIFTWFANCGVFLFGCDVLVQGAMNALPMFLITFGSPFGETFILPALWQGLWQAFTMGIMAGAASNGFLQDKFGRKIMFGVGGLISAVGTAITFVSGSPEIVEQRRGVLLAGKFFIGLAMGISMSTCQTCVSEISPPKLRTILISLYSFMIVNCWPNDCHYGRVQGGRYNDTLGLQDPIRFKGRLGFEGGKRNIHGTRTAVFDRLEITAKDGTILTISTDETWNTTQGPIRMAEIYDGEKYDATAEIQGLSKAGPVLGNWQNVQVLPLLSDDTALVAGSAEPTRRIETIKPISKIGTPSGKLVLDFGQNLVGYLRIRVHGSRGHKITLHHAEVLEHGELGTRPLRHCEDKDTYTLRGEGEEVYEPKFTFHGFRYAQIDNWPGSRDDIMGKVEAVVCHTDMEETGDFSCSKDMLNKLWSNVRWSTKATFLYGSQGILNDWLKGLYYEQKKRNGIPPMVSPNTIVDGLLVQVHPFATWHDVTVLAPWALWEEHGDAEILTQQYDSMVAWLNVVPRSKDADRDHLWHSTVFQLADWLDPSAPPDAPQKSATDMMLVANAFLIHLYDIMVRVAEILGNDDSSVYKAKATTTREQYAKEYISETGRLTSDSQTAYALAICFNLLAEPCQLTWAGDRLAEIVRANEYRVGTGFAGTPFVCKALAKTNHMDVAYGMLLNKKCPSWLYPVTMGATTIWERWDSMIPDGSINPGDMTSFNHYAYGAVANLMVERVAGLKQLTPAWTRCRVDPCVGGGVASARASHLTAHGRISVYRELIERGEEDIHLLVSSTNVCPPNWNSAHSIQGNKRPLSVKSASRRIFIFILRAILIMASLSQVDAIEPALVQPHQQTPNHVEKARTSVFIAGTLDQPVGPDTKSHSGNVELQDQSQRLPFFRLILAYLCLCFCYFISYLDMNSVATSLPTISDALDAGPTVTWVGTSYLLGQLSFQPLYGRISDITGRKPVLLFSMGCIVIGGLLCGFARTPVWLYVCRTISGIGGGGISSSVAIIPVSGSFKEKARKIDWLGVMASIAGIVLTVMAINSGGSMWAWKNVKTISILTIGVIMLLVFVIVEAFFARIPIIPLRLFKQRSPAVLILTGFLHDFAWQSTQYFVPLYYQTVRGFTPLKSATFIVPFLLAQGLAGAASGPIMARYMLILRTGFTIWTIGAGLKLLFNEHTHVAVYTLDWQSARLTNSHQGLVALQANSADEDRAVATGTRNVFRSLGGVVGIAVSTAAYYATLRKALSQSSALPQGLRDRVLDGAWTVGDPTTAEFESAIIDARMQGFRAIFITTIPLMALCLLASFLVNDIMLKGDAAQGGMREGRRISSSTITPTMPSDSKRGDS
ncbi:alpha-L-rhamnosidase [Fusarium denticulatum]|uniref:alpha-L-rhamnosidase n=1 Tax=Fusarium denticulatum TaxID=48507 RepID=A0A8H5TTN8_9HYPO|nr:alpha-L-rhamnosidase [Fusarium denticulatum]